ncbi:amidase [Lentiprolixibacter aurantiacus]|uniref:Amidase n=1 Tax=Lentiprolixibacter aurantiacus TaxID=2993939 RepID=A0AAE3MKP3_9FLAO|nr:amidase [Lentiprolixibacter aurantiacus]MCX2719194.1 amidase [Lentiprolixibacter aurantiacus]
MKKIVGIAFLFTFFSCADAPKEPIVIDIEELTIEKIHQAYQNGEYNSQQLVQAYLERIEQLDSSVNAITYINPDALSVARELDKSMDGDFESKPLYGIPIIVKDNINVIGMPTTAGSRALLNYYPEEDAFIIRKLKEAGAIILAKSNMAEWAFSPMHSESTTSGTTRNPYNLNYVPAGSSGGTAASVALNMGAVGLGTDTGNSIRGPSSHCSLVGLRTTLGLISRSGIVPLMLRNDVVGPMCRTVEDATRVMEVMVGYDPTDSITGYSEGKTVGNYRQFLVENGLEGARIGVLRQIMDDKTDPEIEDLFNNALGDLSALGAVVVDPIQIPNFTELSEDQWCSEFKQDVETFLQQYVRSDSLQTIEDIIQVGTSSEFAERWLKNYANDKGRWGASEAECLDAYRDSRRIAFRTAIRSVMDSLELDAIVYPTWNNRPAKLDRFEEEYKGDNNQKISPHTGQPAFTVPMGFLTDNLPAGIQFLGRMYDEATLIRLAYGYEQGTFHRKIPELD